MHVLNFLKKISRTISDNNEILPSINNLKTNHIEDINDIIKILYQVNDKTSNIDKKILKLATGVVNESNILDVIKKIYKIKFNRDIPDDLLTILNVHIDKYAINSDYMNKISIKKIINNNDFLNDKIDSFDRIMSKVENNTNGYKDALDKLFEYLKSTTPPGKSVNKYGNKYKLYIPASIFIGAATTQFYRIILKAIQSNNIESGCIMFFEKKSCKLLNATCDNRYKDVSNKIPKCNNNVMNISETTCLDWSFDNDKSICKNCNGPHLKCVEQPKIGDILSDVVDMGVDNINTMFSSVGSFVQTVLRYAHYGFLFIIFILFGVIYSKFKSFTSIILPIDVQNNNNNNK